MHPQLLRRLGAALLLGGALLACGASEPASAQELAVVGGNETREAWAGVVYVTVEVREIAGSPIVKTGSGAVLAPNLIATALHVIARDPQDIAFTCDTMGQGSKGSMLGPSARPEKITVFAGPVPGAEPLAHAARIVSSGSSTICQNDIAFLILDRPLELPSFPVYRGPAAEVGQSVTVVGFGAEEPAMRVVRTEREVKVTAVGQWLRTFTVSEGPCQGDSGGPALSERGELVGIFSTVAVECRGPNAAAKYTDLSYFSSLVEEAFEAADAGPPWGPTGAGGEGGQADEPPVQAGNHPGETSAPLESSCALHARGPARGPLAWQLVVAAYLLVRRVGRGRRTDQVRDSRTNLHDSSI